MEVSWSYVLEEYAKTDLENRALKAQVKQLQAEVARLSIPKADAPSDQSPSS